MVDLYEQNYFRIITLIECETRRLREGGGEMTGRVKRADEWLSSEPGSASGRRQGASEQSVSLVRSEK